MQLQSCQKRIWMNIDESDRNYINPYDANVDVTVTFSNRSKWSATFFSYANIDTLRKKNEQTGECMNGTYFWAKDMILIDSVSRERIEEIIEFLLECNEFTSSFSRCHDVLPEDDYLYEKGFFSSYTEL